MHIPSAKNYNEMLTESGRIWFVPSIGNDTNAILLKGYTNVLKAIMTGCRVTISFAINQSPSSPILVSCVQIYDDKDNAMMVLTAHINKNEHTIISKILNRESTPLFLYDELNRNIGWADSSWNSCTDKITQLISSSQPLYTGVSTKDVQSALDNLQISLDPTIVISSATQINFEQIDLVSQSFSAINIYGYSVNDHGHMFNALSEDEGGGFEQSAWQLLENLFDYHLYKSPQTISQTKQKRELTDIFGFSDIGIFLFETKVSAVINTSPQRSTQRRAKNIESQIKKALDQLCGAVRVIKSSQNIVSQSGVQLNFDRQLIPHGVVVISEMIPTVNWLYIAQILMKKSLESSAMLHILDLEELRYLISHSFSIYHFDYYLTQRFNRVHLSFAMSKYA